MTDHGPTLTRSPWRRVTDAKIGKNPTIRPGPLLGRIRRNHRGSLHLAAFLGVHNLLQRNKKSAASTVRSAERGAGGWRRWGRVRGWRRRSSRGVAGGGLRRRRRARRRRKRRGI